MKLDVVQFSAARRWDAGRYPTRRGGSWELNKLFQYSSSGFYCCPTVADSYIGIRIFVSLRLID